MEYIDFIFDTLRTMLGSIGTGSQALGEAIINSLRSAYVLQILFAIQFSIMVFRFVLDQDGFAFLTGFIRNVAIYLIILSALNNWSSLGFGFVRFFDGLVTTSISSAASALSGQNVSGSNAADVLINMHQAFDGEFSRIDQKFEEYRRGFEQRARESSGSGGDPIDGGPVAPGGA